MTLFYIFKILADAMGLGKTIMTISLLLTHSEKDGQPISQTFDYSDEVNGISDELHNQPKKASMFPAFDKLMKQKRSLVNGGNLIICPMTLLGQWKVCNTKICIKLSIRG